MMALVVEARPLGAMQPSVEEGGMPILKLTTV